MLKVFNRLKVIKKNENKVLPHELLYKIDDLSFALPPEREANKHKKYFPITEHNNRKL
jgi:hypothetical protein